MKTDFEKNMHIASDLLAYCHLKGATEYHFDMTAKDGASVFLIKAGPADIPAKEMERLREMLNMPRQREIEQDYWALMGESEDYCELTLVGMMCDEASVDYRDRELIIAVKRRDMGKDITSSAPRPIV